MGITLAAIGSAIVFGLIVGFARGAGKALFDKIFRRH